MTFLGQSSGLKDSGKDTSPRMGLPICSSKGTKGSSSLVRGARHKASRGMYVHSEILVDVRTKKTEVADNTDQAKWAHDADRSLGFGSRRFSLEIQGVCQGSVDNRSVDLFHRFWVIL